MSKLITYPKGAQAVVVLNDWHTFRPLKDSNPELPTGRVIVPFTWWLQNFQSKEVLNKIAQQEIGVWFGVEDDVLQYQTQIEYLKKDWHVIAIDYPIFRDGRGFSTAAILRSTFQWDKQLIAIGDVLVDQLIQMARVGFDAFELRADQSLDLGLSQFSLYDVALQNSWRNTRSQLLMVKA